MANKTIMLSNIEPGEYLSWFATTQAAFKIRMKLYDSKKTYFDSTRQSRSIDPPLNQGAADYDKGAKDLTLYIEIPASVEILTFLNTFTLLTPTGVTVGHGFTCCGEDQDDHDFNDFYLNVMGWKSKG
jgi:hypothetical protein